MTRKERLGYILMLGPLVLSVLAFIGLALYALYLYIGIWPFIIMFGSLISIITGAYLVNHDETK